MNGSVECNGETLVGYLYGESKPEERAAIEAHLTTCPACSRELDEMRGVRVRLDAWEPPETALGFQIVRASDTVKPRTRWLLSPAWLAAAAATLVLAAGAAMANLELRFDDGGVTVLTGRPRPEAPAPSGDPGDRPWQEDLVALERTLRSELARQARPQAAASPSVAREVSSDVPDATLGRMQALLAESEARFQRELALRVAQVTREMEAQRQADLLEIRQGFGQLAGMTGAEVARQRELMNYLIRVSR